MSDFADAVVVITGAAGGIGRVLCRRFSSDGAMVVAVDREAAALATLVAELGPRHRAVVADVTDAVATQQELSAAVATLGKVDVLVNNAGMSPTYESLHTVSEQLWDKTVDVNLKGPFRLAVLAAHHMAAGDGGSIVNIGTAGSLMASVNELPYACAKAGLNALTVGLAEAYAPKVRVNAVLPGPFRTDASKGWAPDGPEVPWVPLGRLGEPEEVAPLVLHLASAASSFTTGAIIRVDGGITRRV